MARKKPRHHFISIPSFYGCAGSPCPLLCFLVDRLLKVLKSRCYTPFTFAVNLNHTCSGLSVLWLVPQSHCLGCLQACSKAVVLHSRNHIYETTCDRPPATQSSTLPVILSRASSEGKAGVWTKYAHHHGDTSFFGYFQLKIFS